MTWVLRDQIDIGNVGDIIAAVQQGYKRRKVKMPQDIDRLALRRAIDQAKASYRTLVDISPRQPWKARADHGRRQIAEITDQIKSIEGEGHGRWLHDQLAARDHDGNPLPLPVVAALKDHRDRLRRQLPDRLDAEQAPGTPLGHRPVAELFGDDPESALQWFVGERLANIFEQYFGMPAEAGASNRNIDRHGNERHYPLGSPFTAFVIAVCKEAGITISERVIAELLSRQRRRKTSTQSP